MKLLILFPVLVWIFFAYAVGHMCANDSTEKNEESRKNLNNNSTDGEQNVK